ncbi:MAG: DNA primase [Cytophagales bacterium]|nr:DNA primase [Cytophagales bacterium]
MPKITKASADRVNSPEYLLDVINDFIEGGLKPIGSHEYKGKSPFNHEKTPSFTVNTQKGIWKCFSSNKGGKSAIKFLMEDKLTGRAMTFPEAAKYVARKGGFDLEYEEATAADDARQRHLKANEFALTYFRHNIDADTGQVFYKEMVDRRAFTKEVLDYFQVGYTINGLYNGLIRYAKDHSFPVADLKAAELVKTNKVDKIYDFFRGRIMFPIRSEHGALAGFSGRKFDIKAIIPDIELKEDTSDQPKYKNSKQSQIFNKSRLLFGLFQARQAIRETGNVFLVEGFTDVMALWMAGIKNTAASCGTAVTDAHAETLARHTNKVTIFMDGDSAGVRAAGRAAEILLKRGLEVNVVVTPGGMDPDEYRLKHGLPGLKQLAEGSAVGFIDHLLERESFNVETMTPAQAEKVASRIAAFIASVPSKIVAERYCASLAKKMQVSTAAVLELVQQMRQERDRPADAKGLIDSEKEIRERIQKDHSAADLEASAECLRLWLLIPAADKTSVDRQWKQCRLAGKWEGARKRIEASPNEPVRVSLEKAGLNADEVAKLVAQVEDRDTSINGEVPPTTVGRLLLKLKLQLVSTILSYSDVDIETGELNTNLSEEEKQHRMRVHIELMRKEKLLKRALVEVIQR